MRKTIWILLLFSLFSCKTDPQDSTQGILPEFKDFKLQYPETYRDTSIVDEIGRASCRERV